MATTTTLYKSAVLAPGEPFTLPPGAELIGATDIDSLDSECDLPDVESLTCYIILLGTTDDEGADRFLREECSTQLKGFYLNNQYTAFNSGYCPDEDDGLFNAPLVLAELQSKLSAIVDFNYSYHPGGSDAGATYLQIVTIPSIGDNLELYLETTASPGLMHIKVPFKKLADAEPNDNYPSSLCD